MADFEENIRDRIIGAIFHRAESISKKVVQQESNHSPSLDDSLDRILTSPWLGFPIMLALLGGVFWLTLVARIPRQLLMSFFFRLGS